MPSFTADAYNAVLLGAPSLTKVRVSVGAQSLIRIGVDVGLAKRLALDIYMLT